VVCLVLPRRALTRRGIDAEVEGTCTLTWVGATTLWVEAGPPGRSHVTLTARADVPIWNTLGGVEVEVVPQESSGAPVMRE